MRGVNHCTFMGNLTRDVECRYTQTGTAVCNLVLAVNERIKKNDKWEEETQWVNLVAWGKTAEFCAQYLNKGLPIYVEGRWQTRTWEKDGQKKYQTEIMVRELIPLGQQSSGPKPNPVSRPPDKSPDGDESDVPF